MIKLKTSVLAIIIALCSLISCHSKNNKADKVDTSAYNTEIFKNQFKMIYGSWRLERIETGWGEINPDFDYLVIKPFGTFAILRNDTILANGSIEIIVQDKEVLDIKFVTNSNINLDLLIDNEKTIKFTNDNLIWMLAPCCDRSNYRLKRK